MNILLTNDDGYLSSGLMLLTEKLSALGHSVYVVVPDGNRSACSHSVNFYKNLLIQKLDNYCGAVEAYICEGTPADCVKYADSCIDIKFDLLISGPNNGDNYGDSAMYSGTIAAAEEGVACGIKSIALSRAGYNVAFSSAAEYVSQNLQQLAQVDIPYTLLNINVPNLPLDQVKGVRVTRQSMSANWNDYFAPTDDPQRWFHTGDKLKVTGEISDITLCDEGYIVIVPLTLERTNYNAIESLKGLES